MADKAGKSGDHISKGGKRKSNVGKSFTCSQQRRKMSLKAPAGVRYAEESPGLWREQIQCMGRKETPERAGGGAETQGGVCVALRRRDGRECGSHQGNEFEFLISSFESIDVCNTCLRSGKSQRTGNG